MVYNNKIFYASLELTTKKKKLITGTQKIQRNESKQITIKSHQISKEDREGVTIAK